MNNNILNRFWSDLSGTFSEFPSMFPIARKITSRAIGMDLVDVKPMRSTDPNVINEVKVINRDRKIDSFTNDKEYEEMKIQDHPDYNGPVGNLFYIDFTYGTASKNP